jgi:hypothetical protein
MFYFNNSLSLEIIIGYLKPIAVFGFAGLFFSIIFFFFPEAIFKSWVRQVAWWYLLILLLITLNTPVYSSNIMSVDRSQVVFGGVLLLAIITIPYILVKRKSLNSSIK